MNSPRVFRIAQLGRMGRRARLRDVAAEAASRDTGVPPVPSARAVGAPRSSSTLRIQHGRDARVTISPLAPKPWRDGNRLGTAAKLAMFAWHGCPAHVARRYSGEPRAGRPYHIWGRKITRVCLFSAWVLALTGCKFKPEHNMEEQPKYFPAYKPSDVFVDGTSARPVPAGAVPRLPADSPGTPYADLRDTLPAATTGGTQSSAIPFPVTAEVVERGQQRFNIYCSVCHGRLGNGEGMIPRRGLTPPPSFHIDRLRQVSDGHYYNVITNGYGAMFSYNDRVKPEDRWMIVAYIRALQAATQDAQGLTEEDRTKLKGVRP